MYTTLISLTLLPFLATTSPISSLKARSPTVAKAGFYLYMKDDTCTDGVLAPPSSTNKMCFNLDANAKRGSIVWPASDDSYQAIFFTGPDCPADKTEKQGGLNTDIYLAKDNYVNGTQITSCFAPIWADPGEGSIWMSPAGVPPPGGWPVHIPELSEA